MKELFLTFRRQRHRARVGNVAVKIPFDVINVVFRQNLVHLLPDVCTHVFAGHIDHILVAAEHGIAPLHMDVPVRMRAEQI